MKLGDLITFRPNWRQEAEWSSPGIVIYKYPAPDQLLWVVYVNGRQCVVEGNNYDIEVLTSS